MRSDDPSSLKEIILQVQEKAASLDSDSTNSRTKFMLETLINLKNNRVKAAQGGEATSEATMRMKKFLSGLEKKRSGAFFPALLCPHLPRLTGPCPPQLASAGP